MSSFGRMNKPASINLPPPLKFTSKRAPPPPTLSFTTSAPIEIVPNDSSSGSSEDEDEPQFVGTPYKSDPSGPYEYPFPPVSPATARSLLLSSSAPFTVGATLSNVSLPSTSSSSSGSLGSLALTPAGTSPGLSSSRIPPPPRFHSRVSSTLVMGLKLDSQGPIPPGLIGRDLGKLSPALGLEPGELITPENMASRSRGKSISTEGALALNLGAPSTGSALTRGPSLKRGMR